jgi:hypothetical protein
MKIIVSYYVVANEPLVGSLALIVECFDMQLLESSFDLLQICYLPYKKEPLG